MREVAAAAAGGAVSGAMVGSVIDTGGASLTVLVGTGALAGVGGKLAEDLVNGHTTTVTEAAVSAAGGAAGAMAGALVGRAGASTTRGAAPLSKEAQKGIRSLEQRIAEHERKLADFKASPTPRPGTQGLSKEIQQQSIDGRIRHLEKEIETFRNNIEKLRGGRP